MNDTITTTTVGVTEFATRHRVSRYAVHRWCSGGLLPGAVLADTLRGPVWLIPADCPRPTFAPGRPPGARDVKARKRRKGRKRAELLDSDNRS